uniref:N-acetylglucosaminylphosphatidylinositol deacetylase n=1 Tax=Timema bartmani TaxID=61472 RepID=A0A7R9I3P4_9NEOP|nr:unnamed protein product [Timema bartmani]
MEEVYLATVYLKVFSVYGHLKVARKVLFVIAHPDDECMFFGPVITKLAQKTDSGMYLLCLSQGDHRNKGPERRRELWASCKILGIPDSHVMICNCTNLPDDPTISWPELDVAALILQHVESLSIDTVITFDKQGRWHHVPLLVEKDDGGEFQLNWDTKYYYPTFPGAKSFNPNKEILSEG